MKRKNTFRLWRGVGSAEMEAEAMPHQMINRGGKVNNIEMNV